MFVCNKMRIFVPTQLVHLYGLVGYLLVKDVYGRYLLTFKSRKFELSSRRYGNGNVHVGCIIFVRVYYTPTFLNMSRRGLTALLILDDGQCESLKVGISEK